MSERKNVSFEMQDLHHLLTLRAMQMTASTSPEEFAANMDDLIFTLDYLIENHAAEVFGDTGAGAYVVKLVEDYKAKSIKKAGSQEEAIAKVMAKATQARNAVKAVFGGKLPK